MRLAKYLDGFSNELEKIAAKKKSAGEGLRDAVIGGLAGGGLTGGVKGAVAGATIGGLYGSANRAVRHQISEPSHRRVMLAQQSNYTPSWASGSAQGD